MAAYDSEIPWVQEKNALWRELAGATITGWAGCDYHVGRDDEAMTFLGKSDPFRQLSSLQLQLDDGSAIDFDTYQNDDVFGLALRRGKSLPRPLDEWSRQSDLSDLPVGSIERLEIHLDDRRWSAFDPVEVVLTIGGRSVLIVAAEIYPGWDAPDYYWADESFFVFTDPAQADEIPWHRQFIARQIRPGAGGGDVFDGARRAITRVTTSRVLDATFPVGCWRAGYDIDETQRLFDAVVETLESYQFGLAPGARRLASTELRNVKLRRTWVRQGCDRREVDAAIRDVAATLEEWERR